MPTKPSQTKLRESSQAVHNTATKTNARKRHIISEADRKIDDSFVTLSHILQRKQGEENECDINASLLAKKLRKYQKKMRGRIMYKMMVFSWTTFKLESDYKVLLRHIQYHLPMLNKHFQLRLRNMPQPISVICANSISARCPKFIYCLCTFVSKFPCENSSDTGLFTYQ